MDNLNKIKHDEFWRGYKVSCEHILQFMGEEDIKVTKGVTLKDMINSWLDGYKNGKPEYKESEGVRNYEV